MIWFDIYVFKITSYNTKFTIPKN